VREEGEQFGEKGRSFFNGIIFRLTEFFEKRQGEFFDNGVSLTQKLGKALALHVLYVLNVLKSFVFL
jgi:hypothetical protein